MRSEAHVARIRAAWIAHTGRGPPRTARTAGPGVATKRPVAPMAHFRRRPEPDSPSGQARRAACSGFARYGLLAGGPFGGTFMGLSSLGWACQAHVDLVLVYRLTVPRGGEGRRGSLCCERTRVSDPSRHPARRKTRPPKQAQRRQFQAPRPTPAEPDELDGQAGGGGPSVHGRTAGGTAGTAGAMRTRCPRAAFVHT